MGYDWLDAEREDGEHRYIESVLEDHKENVIAEYVEDRLASYFEDNPNLEATASSALAESRRILETSAPAALVFAMTAVELAIQDLLLKPVVAGLCHHPDLGPVLARLVDIRTRRAERALFAILEQFDLPNFEARQLEDGRNVWKERDALYNVRNTVVHGGKTATNAEASRAIALADYLLTTLFPEVRDHFTWRSTGFV